LRRLQELGSHNSTSPSHRSPPPRSIYGTIGATIITGSTGTTEL